MPKRFFLFLILLTLAGLSLFWIKSKTKKAPTQTLDIYSGVSYEAIDPKKFKVELLANGLKSVTRLKTTPDGQYLLATQITGEVLAFPRLGDSFAKEPFHLGKVNTRFPGFPPEEGGLTGLVFSADFEKNGNIFLLYTYKDLPGKIQNRISQMTLKFEGEKIKASSPQLIWQANVAGDHSHQITDGVGTLIEGKPHLLFLVGEGFKSERAQDPKLEAGKVLLIQEDGSDPLGNRPYQENKKVQAIGLRNAYVIEQNLFDPNKRFLIADTGPDKYDRLIYFSPLSKVNLGWDGDQEKLALPIPDPNLPEVSDLVIHRLSETRTFTGLVFTSPTTLFATIFGKTGSTKNEPGKEIWLGRFDNSPQPKISFIPIVKRVKEADGKHGHPIGLTLDPITKDLYFADILEGRIYKLTINQ